MGWVSGWKILIIWTYILGPIFGSHYYKTLPVLLTLPPPPCGISTREFFLISEISEPNKVTKTASH